MVDWRFDPVAANTTGGFPEALVRPWVTERPVSSSEMPCAVPVTSLEIRGVEAVVPMSR
jgi:hypothetical protein